MNSLRYATQRTSRFHSPAALVVFLRLLRRVSHGFTCGTRRSTYERFFVTSLCVCVSNYFLVSYLFFLLYTSYSRLSVTRMFLLSLSLFFCTPSIYSEENQQKRSAALVDRQERMNDRSSLSSSRVWRDCSGLLCACSLCGNRSVCFER